MMINDIVLLDLFSGIGGFSLGLTQAGFKITTHYYSEIDKHAIANYRYNFKHSEYVGSVTDLGGRTITRPNIITFGSPCQDFSVVGRRTGLEGQRSSLIGEAIRLIAECRPDLFIWENVKGVFSSSDGRDFWAVIQAFTDIGGYRLEWQLLNTAWFLPQNRERIYLIGHLAERGRRLIFPIEQSNTINDEIQSEQRGQGARASCLNVRYGQRWTDETYIVAQRGRENGQELEIQKDDKTNSLTGVQKDNLLMIEHEDKFRFYRNDEKKSGVQGKDVFKDIAKTMDVIDNHPKNIIIPPFIVDGITEDGFKIGHYQVGDYRSDEGLRIRDDGNCPTLQARAREDGSGQPMIIQINPSLESGGKQPYQHNRIYDASGIMVNLDNDSRKTVFVGGLNDHNRGDGSLSRDYSLQDRVYDADKSIEAVTVNATSSSKYLNNSRIRRLTEIECERLQGFPDNWTEYGDYNGEIKKIAKTQRYKMLGNAVTVIVVKEIGGRLIQELVSL